MSAGSNRRTLRLLVADDERDAVRALASILSDEAIAWPTPTALRADISGLTVAREMKRIYGEATPLMSAISGIFIGESDRMLTEIAGFDHFLQKPCDTHTLLALLEPLRATIGN